MVAQVKRLTKGHLYFLEKSLRQTINVLVQEQRRRVESEKYYIDLCQLISMGYNMIST